MGGEGQIFVVQGLLGNTASNARYEGLQKALEEYPNIEVVADDTANWNTDEALGSGRNLAGPSTPTWAASGAPTTIWPLELYRRWTRRA